MSRYHNQPKVFGPADPEQIAVANEQLKAYNDQPSCVWVVSPSVAARQSFNDSGVAQLLPLPCFWPHLVILTPFFCVVYHNTKLTYKSTIFILGTKEPQALYRIRHVQGCCNTSGIDCAKVDIKDITSMAIDREGTTCLLRTNNAIKMGLPLGHTMGTTHKGRRGVVILTPEVSLLVDAEWLEETFKILNEASEKAKGAAGGSNTNSTSPVDPVEALEKLKVLLSKGLISQSEYDAKRGDVMERF
eukprot:CAMPEP_0173277442 /NCGR_PEP_ID=MMETSP1143-20121109/4080_1 /TAXON_ID=483371 /ORGANISM="non described non described, Strain CCMP2298" /LENGTH=244 /DNA_ID=CAMNT_0014214529 /DNA_START=14 /DNA_END=748 /DNA_ORIENTATION=+